MKCQQMIIGFTHTVSGVVTVLLYILFCFAFFFLLFFQGGWNNNPNASQFKYIFRKLMARSAVVKPSSKGNVTAQDETESLPAVATSSTAQSYLIDTSIASLSAVDMSSAEGEDLPSPFADIPALVGLHDHSYLPKHFDGLVENVLVYISGRVRMILDLAYNQFISPYLFIIII